MHYILSLFFFFSFLFCTPISVQAEEPTSLVKSKIVNALFEAKINVEDHVPVGETILFDASDSSIYPTKEEGEAKYIWNFFDENGDRVSKSQIHTYNTPGKKRVKLTIQQGDKEISAEKEIFVYFKKALLITDVEQQSFLKDIELQASETGTWLQTLLVERNNTGFVADEKFLQKIQESSDILKDSNIIIFYTELIDSFSIFTRFYTNLKNKQAFPLDNINFIQLTDGNLSIQKNIVDRSRKILNIPHILLTRKEALNPIFISEDLTQISQTLQNRAIENIMINKDTQKFSALFLSKTISFFIKSGVPSNTIYLLLVFPFLALFVAFSRQFIGFSTFGVYLPIMLSLSFFVLGVKFAFMVIALVFLTSIFIRLFLTKIDMLYIPKVALSLSIISLSFFIIIGLSLYTNSSMVISIAIFPMLIISTLSEKFISTQSQEGMWSAMIDMIETILVSFFAYFLADLTFFRDLLLSLPELIFLPFIAIFILGKFTGLRMTEYFKFRSILREGAEEE